MRALYWIQVLLLALSLPAKGMSGQEAIMMAGMKNGTITAVSLEDNTINIDQKALKLSDNLSVMANDTLISKVLLTPGLQVAYWTAHGPSSGEEEVIKIKVTSKFNPNSYQR